MTTNVARWTNGRGGDASNLADFDRLHETVRAKKGHLDILYANAGVGEFNAPVGSITEANFDNTFNLNVRGTLFAVQKALPLMTPVEEFLRVWKVGDWNQFRIRCVGELPHLTTWINGVKIAELDTARMKAPKWDPQETLQKLGRAGHIALEVHSNGPNDKLGKDRWAPGAACRWRNISIKTH